MKKLLMAGVVAMAGLLPLQAHAGEPLYLTKDTPQQIGKQFSAAMNTGGIVAVQHEIDGCYMKAQTGPTMFDMPLLQRCFLYDMAAYKFNRTMTELFKMHGVDVDKDPVRYFADDAFILREKYYGRTAFPDISRQDMGHLWELAQIIDLEVETAK